MNEQEIDKLLEQFEHDEQQYYSDQDESTNHTQITENNNSNDGIISTDQIIFVTHEEIENENSQISNQFVIVENQDVFTDIQITEDNDSNDDVISTDQIIFVANEDIDNENSQITNQVIFVENQDASTDDIQIIDDNVTTRLRNKKSSPKNWKRNLNKVLRMEGKDYVGYRRTKNKVIFHDVNKKARKIGPTCCSKACEKSSIRMCNSFSEDDRLKIFNDFWSNLNWDEKKLYVSFLVKKIPVERRRVEASVTSRRTHTFYYYLKLNNVPVSVCKTMFLNTLRLGEYQVHSWCLGRELVENEPFNKKSSQPREKSAHKTFAKTFLDKLPKMESHYCRQSSSKLYLEPLIQSKSSLYNLYVEQCNTKGETFVSRKTFIDIFEKKNLSLFQPKKDQCDICCGHKTKNISDEDYNKHIQDKDRSRHEKNMDKEKAILGEVQVFTMDLQAVKICPSLKASALYYKCKLCVHNFTMYNLATQKCMCYWWDETQSDLSASSFTSCIIDHLKMCYNENPNNNSYILWSDGCCYQNKNAVLSSALLKFAEDHKISIEQKYLTKGHTQMECDSVHSSIERKLKNQDIYIPSDYQKITKIARIKPFPYNVKECDFNFFLNYQTKNNKFDSIRPGKNTGDPTVTQIKAIRYNCSGTIDFKVNFDDEYSDLALAQKKRKKGNDVDPAISYSQLHKEPLKIPKTKWDHLQQLKAVLPHDCHAFYDQIKY